jgi:hypothetical protein
MEMKIEHGFIRNSVAAHIKTRFQYLADQRKKIAGMGLTPVKATYDRAGNCVFCGEAGRCPGWHTVEEIKRLLSRYDVINW